MRESPWQYVSELKQVFHLSEFREPHDGIDIVMIPGLEVQHTVEIQSRRCSWLKRLAASTDYDTRGFIFKYNIEPSKDGSVWHRLLGLSTILLDALRQARPCENERRPLYFICHSIGGILLKRALCLARHDYPTIRNALSGIIFLSTPHLTSISDERWENWSLILKLFQRDIPKTTLCNQDIEMLANICGKFTGLNLGIQIISAYETMGTKVQDASPLGQFREVDKVLVDRSHATLNMEHEELFGVNAPHSELQFVNTENPLFNRVVEYLNTAPLDGVAMVTNAGQQLEIDFDFSDTYGRTSSPPDATHGSGESSVGDIPDVTPPPRRALLPCYCLGQNRNSKFFGQKKFLDLIDTALLPLVPSGSGSEHNEGSRFEGSTNLRTFAICGMGGLGKSEIAIEYVHSRKKDFDAIFWVNSASTQKLDAGFRDIALKLGLQDEAEILSDDPAVIRSSVKAWLANPGGSLGVNPLEHHVDVNWLIVFDNADQLGLLSDFWPLDSAGSILLTSRNPLARHAHFANLSGIDLPPMSPEDAGRLLQKTSFREDEPNSLETCSLIAERLGRLPLAIMQMGHLILIKHLSLLEFVEYYNHDMRKFQEFPVPGLTEQQTVTSIWNIESLPPPAVALLHVLSVLDPDLIYEDILVTGAKHVKLENYPQAKTEYFEAREVLIKSSLVARNIELGFIKIHRLVQDVVRQKMSIQEFRAVYNAAVTLVSAVWPFVDDSNLNEVKRLRRVQRYFPQVASFRKCIEKKTPETLKAHINVSALFNEASWYDTLKRLRDEIVDIFTRSYILQSWGYNLLYGAEFARLSQQVLAIGNAEGDERLHSKLLADSYRFQGITGTYMDSELAVPTCENWIRLLVDRIEKYQDPIDIKTMPIAYNELGMALMRIHSQEEALKSWDMSCDTILQSTNPGDLPFPFPWVHRAIVSAYSGDADTGYSLLLPILEKREKRLGVDDTSTIETGFILSFMGNICRLQGRYEDAYNFHHRGAVALKVTTGECSSFTTQAFYRLARDYFERGAYQKASELLEKCISFAGDIPWYQPEAARSAWKRGRTLKAICGKENEDESKRLLDKAMLLRRDLDPEDHREEPELSDDDWDKMVYYFSR